MSLHEGHPLSVHGPSNDAPIHGEPLTDDPTRPGAEWASAEWQPPSLLDAPPPRLGMVQRWIRVSVGKEVDAKRWYSARRIGWVPRDPATLEGFDAPTMSHPQFGGCIGINDLILCEIPAERDAARRRYYDAKLEKQQAAIEQELKRSELPGSPIRREARTTVTIGRKPKVAPDGTPFYHHGKREPRLLEVPGAPAGTRRSSVPDED